jgi:hypothetical protein
MAQKPLSDAEGLECSDGGSWPLTEARECTGVGISGGGDSGLPSNMPGEGVSVDPREIFSLMARSLTISCSSSLRRACISLFAFSRAEIWLVAETFAKFIVGCEERQIEY